MNERNAPGAAPSGMIPLCVPEIRGNEWTYIKECLDANWVSSAGSYVGRFEEMLADYIGVNHAVAMVNGTAAIHIALLCAGVEPDDEVLVSDLTFIAPVNAIRYVGAWPVLVDADRDSWQMDTSAVVNFLRNDCELRGKALFNKTTGRRIAAILPVHILGHPVDMDQILQVASELGLPVIEDATESLGAKYKGQAVGALGDISCLSFNGNKLITTGGGGMLLTNDRTLAERARYLSTQAKDDPLEYVHNAVGYNYRLTNLQAAMGCAQVEQLASFVRKKRAIASRYDVALAELDGIQPVHAPSWSWSVYWLYTVLVDEEICGVDRKGLQAALAAQGIQTRPLWTPIHCNLPYRDAEVLGGENAVAIQSRALSLPCSVGLDGAAQTRVCDAVRDVLATHHR